MDAPKLDKFKDTLNWAVDRNKFFGHGYGAVLVMFGDAIAEIERLQNLRYSNKVESLQAELKESDELNERYRKALERIRDTCTNEAWWMADEALKGDSHDQS